MDIRLYQLALQIIVHKLCQVDPPLLGTCIYNLSIALPSSPEVVVVIRWQLASSSSSSSQKEWYCRCLIDESSGLKITEPKNLTPRLKLKARTQSPCGWSINITCGLFLLHHLSICCPFKQRISSNGYLCWSRSSALRIACLHLPQSFMYITTWWSCACACVRECVCVCAYSHCPDIT